MSEPVFCPLSIIGGEPMECVRFDGSGGTCYLCPLESMDRTSGNLHDLVTVLNASTIADAIDGLTGAVSECTE